MYSCHEEYLTEFSKAGDLLFFGMSSLARLLYAAIVGNNPGGGGGGYSLYNGLHGEVPPERDTFFTLQVYKRVGISFYLFIYLFKHILKLIERAHFEITLN